MPEESLYNTFPSLRLLITALEADMLTYRRLRENPDGVEFNVMNAAMLKSTTAELTLHELRDLLACWEKHHSGKIPLSWHVLAIVAAVYGVVLLVLVFWMTGVAAHG